MPLPGRRTDQTWSTASNLGRDVNPVEHIGQGKDRVRYPLYRLTVCGVPIVTNLTAEDVVRLVPAHRRELWARQVAALMSTGAPLPATREGGEVA